MIKLTQRQRGAEGRGFDRINKINRIRKWILINYVMMLLERR